MKYVNIDIKGTTNPLETKTAVYNETQTAPILHNPSEWSLSVVRFDVTTLEMPVYLFEDIQNSNVYKYKVNLRVSGIRVEVPVDFYQLSSKSIYQSTGTYAIYSYTGIMDAINQAYNTALVLLRTDYEAKIAPWPGTFPTQPPRWRLKDDNKIQIFWDPRYTTNSFSIGVNNELVNKFPSFNWTILPGFPFDCYLDISDKTWNYISFNSFSYLFTQESGFSVQNWNTVRQLVFKTSIPVESEYESGQSVDRIQVLTDFDISGIVDGTNIKFYPTGPLRHYRLVNTSPLYEINLRLQWRDRFGVLRDWIMGTSDYVSVKLMLHRNV